MQCLKQPRKRPEVWNDLAAALFKDCDFGQVDFGEQDSCRFSIPDLNLPNAAESGRVPAGSTVVLDVRNGDFTLMLRQ